MSHVIAIRIIPPGLKKLVVLFAVLYLAALGTALAPGLAKQTKAKTCRCAHCPGGAACCCQGSVCVK